jgi:hypothetical protein
MSYEPLYLFKKEKTSLKTGVGQEAKENDSVTAICHDPDYSNNKL